MREIKYIFKGFLLSIFILILSSCDPVKTDLRLNGKSQEYLIEKFGKPDYTKEFVLSSKLYEYQYGLLSKYPSPDGKNIRIKEISWLKWNKRKTVWFDIQDKKWISIDNITWNPDKVCF